MTLLERFHEHVREVWTLLALSIPDGWVEDHHGVTCIATGSESPSFNPAFPSHVVASPPEALDAVVNRYRRANLRWLLKLHPERDSAMLEKAQGRAVEFSPVPLFALSMDAYEAPAIPEELSVVPATETNIDDAVRCLAEGFDADNASIGRELGTNLLAVPRFTVFIGYVDEEPVATSVLAETEGGGLAGVYSVATRPNGARRGFGTALTAAAIDEAARRRHRAVVLEPSDMAESMYRRMGFTQFDSYAEAVL
ncbi:MAG: GNAT family N-acetyltransferase [Actinomycetota bacterium]|nr:GNAT family N-acetyltransferase [Actinomycetota bacterium]